MDWEAFFPPRTPVLALPSWESPRLYMPAQGFLRRWNGSSFYPAWRPLARLYRLWLRARATVGLVPVRITRSGSWPFGAFIEEALAPVASAAVLVGTPGPTQKITIQLWDGCGKVVGYLKYGEKAAACSRLQWEYHILSVLPKGAGPMALSYGSLGDGMALCLSPVPGKRPGFRPSGRTARYTLKGG
jgi:hypothetical protein